MTEPIFAELEHKLEHGRDAVEHDIREGWDAFRELIPHRRYHDPDAAAIPATEEPAMNLITELKNDAQKLAAKFDGIDEAAAAKMAALEGNPVLDALVSAAHVPPNALSIVVDVLKGLGEIYPKDVATADPAVQPEPAATAA